MEAHRMHVSRNQGKRISFQGTENEWRIDRSISSTMMSFISMIPPESGIPLHIHHKEDEYIFLIQGRLTFQLGESVFPVEPGDTVYMPKGVLHGFRSTGSEDAHILFTIALNPDSRYDTMFDDIAGTGVEDFDKLKSICNRNNVEFLSPPRLP